MRITTGETYRAYGETIEVTNSRGDEVCLNYADRTAPDGGAHAAWRPRETVEAVAEAEAWDLVGNDESADEGARMDGAWVSTPRCPECGAFMSRDFDGAGLPAASCTAADCRGWSDVDDLIDAGHFDPSA